jgi:hypothetical protein
MTTNRPKPPITLTDPEDRGKLKQGIHQPHQPSLDYHTLADEIGNLGERNHYLFSGENKPYAESYYGDCEEQDILLDAFSALAKAAVEASSHDEELTYVEAALAALHTFEKKVELSKLDEPDLIPQACAQLEMARNALQQGETLLAPPEAPRSAITKQIRAERDEEGPYPANGLYQRGVDYLACYYCDNPDAEGEFDNLRDETLEKIQEARAAFIRANEHHDPDIERIYLQHVLDAVNEAQRAWRADEGRDNVLLKQLLPKLEARRDELDGHSQEPPDLPQRG